ncbi:MAG: hypothetical protein ACKO1N_12120 [Erythrobacter sp.]
MVYAMPVAFDATKTACANRLSSNGFIATGGEAYIAQFREGQDKAWPGAFRLLKAFMADQQNGQDAAGMDMDAMIASMPEEALRPFIDAFLGQMIAKEIKGDTCGKIERGLELISPLPSQNVGGLMAFAVELADLKNPPICRAAATATGTASK